MTGFRLITIPAALLLPAGCATLRAMHHGSSVVDDLYPASSGWSGLARAAVRVRTAAGLLQRKPGASGA